MTVTELQPAIAPRPATARTIGQVTAVEQARAVAEVAAAVQVAQQFPRDLDRVRREVQIACSSYELAREAFYAVKNRGEGLSVHLARELAAIYGNFQSGVHELRRDDDAGESEVQAFAWDLERNTRQVRTFIHPHARMKNGQRQALTDLHDIYLSNQNVGARAVRECIFAALPKWLVRQAEDACQATLERGTGESAPQRAAKAVEVFAGLGVTEQQLVARIGRSPSEWTPQDIASLEVIYGSLRRGETTIEEQFPVTPPTAEEIDESRAHSARPAAPARKAAQPRKATPQTPPPAETPVPPAEEQPSGTGESSAPPVPEEPADEAAFGAEPCPGCGEPVRHSPTDCPGAPDELDMRLDDQEAGQHGEPS